MHAQLQRKMRARLKGKDGTMSAPNTDLEKQKKEHKPALIGIRAAMIFAGILLLGLIVWTVWQGDSPETPDVRIDGRTGQEVEVE